MVAVSNSNPDPETWTLPAPPPVSPSLSLFRVPSRFFNLPFSPALFHLRPCVNQPEQPERRSLARAVATRRS
eukprot:1139223-Rhodomonas_salina.2